MSQQNVALARRVHQAFNDRDVDAFLALVDEKVEAHPRLAPVEGWYCGHSGILEWWKNVRDAYSEFHSELLEVRDLGDRTLMIVHDRARGAESDIPVEQRSWHLVEWRDGKVIRWTAYDNETEALEAAGI